VKALNCPSASRLPQDISLRVALETQSALRTGSMEARLPFGNPFGLGTQLWYISRLAWEPASLMMGNQNAFLNRVFAERERIS
jgi:hypothetical protein